MDKEYASTAWTRVATSRPLRRCASVGIRENAVKAIEDDGGGGKDSTSAASIPRSGRQSSSRTSAGKALCLFGTPQVLFDPPRPSCPYTPYSPSVLGTRLRVPFWCRFLQHPVSAGRRTAQL